MKTSLFSEPIQMLVWVVETWLESRQKRSQIVYLIEYRFSSQLFFPYLSCPNTFVWNWVKGLIQIKPSPGLEPAYRSHKPQTLPAERTVQSWDTYLGYFLTNERIIHVRLICCLRQLDWFRLVESTCGNDTDFYKTQMWAINSNEIRVTTVNFYKAF